MLASVMFRPGRHYRADSFAKGLARHGFRVSNQPNSAPRAGDLLVIWNRTRVGEQTARRYEAAGARVVVAENGYLDRHDGAKHYALALSQHNGCGQWFVGPEPRFAINDEEAQPLRDGPVLVLAQRGIGAKGVAMPLSWSRDIMDQLRRMTRRPVILRRHPGNHGIRQIPLESQLAEAALVVTWGSGAAIKAIRAGLPCFHALDGWIGNCASTRLADTLDRCDEADRGELWRRVSWAQWTLGEIEDGTAFDRLLHDANLFSARGKD